LLKANYGGIAHNEKATHVEFVFGLLLPLAAAAQNDFDGTWKIDLSKTVPATEPEINTAAISRDSNRFNEFLKIV